MLFILAPSKTMDMSPMDTSIKATIPMFQKDAEYLVRLVKTTKNIAELMKISPALAETTRQKYIAWGNETKQALFCYVGDVYKGFYAHTLTPSDIDWAQSHLRIMSGLYGLLQPLDLISPYRLEMKASLKVDDKKDIYDFWGKRLAEAVDREADDGIICVLSSDEYARPITRFSKSTIITPVFYDNKVNGKVGTVPIYSKMMRGVLARWIIDNRIDEVEKLQSFSAQGYVYSAELSSKTEIAFFRDTPKPIFYKK